MRIVFICAEFPVKGRPTGGFGAYVDRITSALANLNCQITIICEGDRRQLILEKDRTIIVIPPFGYDLINLVSNVDNSYLKRLAAFLRYPLLFSLSVAIEISRLNSIEPIDIVEGGDFGAELFCYLLFKIAPFPKTIIKLHTPSFLIRKFNKEPLTIFYKIIERMEFTCLRKADSIYSPTRALATIVKKKFNIRSSKIIPYPSPVMQKVVGKKIKRDTSTILYAGKLQSKKGIFILIEALKPIVEKFKKIKFIIIGPNTTESGLSVKKQLLKLIKKKQLQRFVIFKDFMEQKKLNRFFRKVTLTVIPSLWENFPNLILEAVINGSPVVAAKTGGIAEMIVHNKSGILVTPNNPVKLSHGILRLLNSKALCRALVKNARKRFNKIYAPESIATATLKFYTDTL